MNIWFTSDYHFNHFNIIRYTNRPFKTLDEMNSTLIKNHNERVKPEDTVYFLGDFIFKNSLGGKVGEGLPDKAEDWVKKLNGNIVFIAGNHDKNNSLKTHISKLYLRYGGMTICCVHNPLYADSNCELNLVGHVHEKWKIRPLGKKSIMVNVGVDVWSFKPICFGEIQRAISEWKKLNATNQNKQVGEIIRSESTEER